MLNEGNAALQNECNMESRELSESMQNIEKDATENVAPAQEQLEKNENENVVATEEPSAVDDVATAPEAPVEPEAEARPAEVSEALTDATPSPQAAEPAADKAMDLTGKSKTELVALLQQLSEQPVETVKDDVNNIKAAFFAIRRDEIAKEKEEFLQNGGDESAFAAKVDATEEQLKDLLNVIKEKKAEYNAAQEAVKVDNLKKKKEIIAQIEAITDDPDNINRQYNKVKQLQQDFKEVGPVPATSETEVWKSFQMVTEKFYDLLKINKELRDYDFRKNLEAKQQLCADAEALDEENDVVTAFKKLQEMHNKWREIGPVAKELREDLWARFKAASAVINKKHQAYFEERKSKEKENAEAKTALCEQIEQVSTEGLTTYAQWEEATKKIIEMQAEWKKLGFASRKVNTALFTRFRKSCDEFFSKKAEFFKQMKETLAANLAKKYELCEKAEALKESTDWKKTTDALVALQKEWKTIGPVVKKHSDTVWKRFIGACDYFFEQKKKQNTNVHAVEHDNLKAKKEVISQLRLILEGEEEHENAAQEVRDLMGKWQSIGHVPYKEKDKIYNEYRELIDKAFEVLDMRGTRAQLSNFESTIAQSSEDRMSHERERLMRTYEQRCAELKTYENNMGFFNSKSKAGDSLVKEMERKIESLKNEISLLEQKIKIIDEH